MNFPVVLIESEGGYAVGCSLLPGCWSQGATRDEALANIRDAIKEVLEVRLELAAEDFRREGVKVDYADVNVEIDTAVHA